MREDYITYLGAVRNLSPHTLESYGKDLEKYETYLGTRTVAPEDAGISEARGFVTWLSHGGLAPRSINRIVSGVRGWYRYMEKRNLVHANPFAEIRSLRTEKRLPSFLFEDEMARLIEMPSHDACPDRETFWKMRDRAVLETLYSTGCRISELVSLDVSDVDLKNRTARVLGKGSRERYVFLGAAAVEALSDYMTLSVAHTRNVATDGVGPGPLHQPPWRKDHRPRREVRPGGISLPRQPGQAGDAPHVPPFLCHASSGQGRRHQGGAGAARPREPVHDPGLHPRGCGKAQKSLQEGASPCRVSHFTAPPSLR